MTAKVSEEFPRRCWLELNTPAELAIREAILAVEQAGTHPFLTTAVVLLGHAREKVADFVDLSMTVDQAIDIVARHALHLAAVSDSISESLDATWENYPTVGESDWELVTERIAELCPNPSETEFAAALALLAERAEGEEG